MLIHHLINLVIRHKYSPDRSSSQSRKILSQHNLVIKRREEDVEKKIFKTTIKRHNRFQLPSSILLRYFSVFFPTRLDSLVPVVSRLVRTFDRDADVLSLGRGELGQVGSELAQVKSSNLLVQMLGKDVNLLLILAT